MDKWTREHLRVILSVALALVPKRIGKDWNERVAAKTQPAKTEIVDRLIAGIDQQFEVEKKPEVCVGPALNSREAMKLQHGQSGNPGVRSKNII